MKWSKERRARFEAKKNHNKNHHQIVDVATTGSVGKRAPLRFPREMKATKEIETFKHILNSFVRLSASGQDYIRSRIGQ